MGSITEVIRGVNTGDSGAALHLWERYVRQLLVIARRSLNQRLHRRHDEDDVVQSVFKSFFEGINDGAFRLQGRDELWQLLLTILLRKVRNAARKHSQGCRDFRREDVSDAPSPILEREPSPTPAEAVAFNDELHRLLKSLPKAEFGEILMLRFYGYTNSEIAKELDYDVRTVERKAAIIRSIWISEFDDTEV